MSIDSEINRLSLAKSNIRSAIISKGVSVSASDTLDKYADKVNAIIIPNITVRSGSTTPSDSLGNDGDIYLKI